MKDPSRPPSGRPPFQSEPDPKRDTPFDAYRYSVQTMPQVLRRELIGIELPLLDPKDLNDTNPPNGGLSWPEAPPAPPKRNQRSLALVAIGLVALVVIGAAVIWPVVSSPEPAVSSATSAVTTPSEETGPKPDDTSDEQVSVTPSSEPDKDAREMPTAQGTTVTPGSNALPSEPAQRVTAEKSSPRPPSIPPASPPRQESSKPTPSEDRAKEPPTTPSPAVVQPKGEESLIQLEL